VSTNSKTDIPTQTGVPLDHMTVVPIGVNELMFSVPCHTSPACPTRS